MTKLTLKCALASLLFAFSMDASGADSGQSPVTRIGHCTLTTVAYVGARAGTSGSAIQYANGMWQVDYNTISGIVGSRIGDQVLLCLTDVPIGCPPGDDRGRTYKGTNLRTRESWSAIDSEHSCGGA